MANAAAFNYVRNGATSVLIVVLAVSAVFFVLGLVMYIFTKIIDKSNIEATYYTIAPMIIGVAMAGLSILMYLIFIGTATMLTSNTDETTPPVTSLPTP
jgi:hypothetical protein